jgi:hypothetical protein
MPSEPVDVYELAVRIAQAFESVGARYALVGSMASSLQGDPRSTNDIDFVTTLSADRIRAFVEAIGAEFDVDEDALAVSLRSGGSWNIFYLPWMTKIDLFALENSELRRTQLSRAIAIPVEGGSLFVLRPDDTVLSKLIWYRDGGGVSDQQWRDIIGVLRVSAKEIDDFYLDDWAAREGLTDLLRRARDEAR